MGVDHADEGNERRGWAHAQQGLQIDLETDVEEQHQHADLGQKGQGVIRARVGEHLHARQNQGEVAEADPRQQLAEHRRLSETLRQQPAGLRGQNQDGDREEQRAERGCSAPAADSPVAEVRWISANARQTQEASRMVNRRLSVDENGRPAPGFMLFVGLWLCPVLPVPAGNFSSTVRLPAPSRCPSPDTGACRTGFPRSTTSSGLLARRRESSASRSTPKGWPPGTLASSPLS